MGYKIVKALQPLDLAKRHVKRGDQIELDEKEADDLIKRGLAEEGRIDSSDAGERHPDSLKDGAPTDTSSIVGGTDHARPLSTSSMLPPDNKMNPDGSSNK